MVANGPVEGDPLAYILRFPVAGVTVNQNETAALNFYPDIRISPRGWPFRVRFAVREPPE
jgi:hypothetical protein